MARRSPLPQREAEICSRLRQAREESGLSRVVLAQKTRIDSSKLTSYEYARTPVPYAVVKQLGEILDVNQRWLATGVLPKKSYIVVSEALEAALPPKALFSFAYDNLLADELDEIHRDAAKRQGVEEKNVDPMVLDAYQPLGDHEAVYRAAAMRVLEFTMMIPGRLSNDLLDKYVVAIDKVANGFLKKHKAAISEAFKKRESDQQRHLATITAFYQKKLADALKK